MISIYMEGTFHISDLRQRKYTFDMTYEVGDNGELPECHYSEMAKLFITFKFKLYIIFVCSTSMNIYFILYFHNIIFYKLIYSPN